MDYEHLIVEPRGEVLWVTMNRPERLNALNRKLVEELRDLFVGLYWRHEIRIVCLRGAGANFCAGLDLKERDNSGGSGPGNGLIRQRQISDDSRTGSCHRGRDGPSRHVHERVTLYISEHRRTFRTLRPDSPPPRRRLLRPRLSARTSGRAPVSPLMPAPLS